MSAVRAITRVRHETRVRMLEVVAMQRITPHMVRVTLGGTELAGFTSLGFDDHVRVFFPSPGAKLPILPSRPPGAQTALPGAAKPTARDYTPRRFDADRLRLEIDFALHGNGPATAWAAQAQPGHHLGVGGPRSSFIIPIDFQCHLLVGDETALPAIARRLEELPASARAIVIAEVDSAADEQTFVTGARLETHWLHRGDAAAGSPLRFVQALGTITLPKDETFAWVAGESGVVKALRLHLVDEQGFPKDHVKAAGYWKHGADAVHEKFED
jgi:NADPH-dependent ferric siderophore reductase